MFWLGSAPALVAFGSTGEFARTPESAVAAVVWVASARPAADR
ncbi:hypothetical protein [Streptomonospora salina]